MENTAPTTRWCFLDRDGVLVKDTGYVYKIEDLEILPNVVEGLLALAEIGFKFIVITNQAGIAKGYYKHEDAHSFNKELHARLAESGILIHAVYMCPHHPKHTGECSCRKPNTGMLDQAAHDLGVTPERAILVGDKDSDIETGKKWGCKTFRIINEQYPEIVVADYRARDLHEVARIATKNAPM